MAKRRVDYSRMVSLDLTPTEAALLSELIGSLIRTSMVLAEDESEAIKAVMQSWVDHLNLQLDQLAWPTERRRAPFPV